MKAVIALLLLFSPAMAQAPPALQHERAIVAAWNEIGESITLENELLTALTKSLQLNPPWRVLDARAPAERADLIDKIIVEHRRRLKLLEKIKAEDSK